MSTKLGQGPLAPAEYQAIKQILIALIADHGPDAVEWAWNKLSEATEGKGILPTVRKQLEEGATAETKKGSGALVLVGAALLFGGKKKRARR